MAMTITVDGLLPRPKLGCDGRYNMVVKGLNVVVSLSHCHWLTCDLTLMANRSPSNITTIMFFRDGQNSLTSMLIIIFKGGLYMAAFVNPNKIQKTHYDIQLDPGLDLGHASSTRRPRRSARRHCRAHAATVDLHATTESTQLLQPSS
jgi:hypothetical protein